ncbi:MULTISPECIES: AEC family transporter [unclassified Ruminococcus]|uniref:AEC family transporter n=1 Tax=unclassified Ruminococcus TaxID=2608920 RepID=UPI0021091AA3|nr:MULTISPECIES: AEC family transporter [unclassified Ruminococcus]
MLQNFLTVGQQVLIIFILIAVGFICGKTKLIKEDGAQCITNIVLYAVTPCLMIEAFQREFDPSMLFNLAIVVIAAFAVHIISILIAKLAIHDKDKSRETVLRFSVIFSNCGFMCLPLEEALLGSEGVFYGGAFVAVFNIMVWTYGLVAMSGDKKQLSIKKLALNPGIMGVLIGLTFFLLSVKLPDIVMAPISLLSDLNTPLPMLVIGYYLYKSSIKDALCDKKSYLAIALRLVVIPILSLAILYLCGIRGTLLLSTVIAASAPVAATTTMFATKFNKSVAVSVNLVSLSTIFSIITMSAIVGFAQTIS